MCSVFSLSVIAANTVVMCRSEALLRWYVTRKTLKKEEQEQQPKTTRNFNNKEQQQITTTSSKYQQKKTKNNQHINNQRTNNQHTSKPKPTNPNKQPTKQPSHQPDNQTNTQTHKHTITQTNRHTTNNRSHFGSSATALCRPWRCRHDGHISSVQTAAIWFHQVCRHGLKCPYTISGNACSGTMRSRRGQPARRSVQTKQGCRKDR